MTSSTAEITILCVDDEANILAALRRLFRPQGYRILIAEGGAAALMMLEAESGNVDLVISDMRMPEMDGATFLTQVRAKWPNIIRILLTGYADMESTISAINEGQIYRYLTKPWNDNDVLLTVRDALERRALEQEKKRLEALTQKQNEELKQLNSGLEEKVSARTQELTLAHEKLKRSFMTSIQMFSNMLELRSGNMAGHSCRVADLSLKIARKLGWTEQECQDVFLAALLHDIGKIGLSDELLNKPINQMSGEELGHWRRHPAKAEQALLGLDSFRQAAIYIRAHHERFDGQGFPDGLSGMMIPSGARILAVTNEFDGHLSGNLNGKRASENEAFQFIAQGRGKRYDPQIVDIFMEISGRNKKVNTDELEMTTGELISGMQLSRVLLNHEGVILLTANQILNENVIEQLRGFERTDGTHLKLWIRASTVR